MIPIECPKCGRGGNVPPDRLNARLICKACHSVFYMDNSGKLMLGEPGNPDKKANRHAESARSKSEFTFTDSWNKIPAPVKFGIPAAALAALLWVNYGPGPGEADYIRYSQQIMKAVAANDKSQVLTYASEGTADDAGKWFELVHDAFTKKNVGPNTNADATLWGGDPSKGSEIQTSVIISDPVTSEQFPISINVYMTKGGSSWSLDGTKTLGDTEKLFATLLPKKSSR